MSKETIVTACNFCNKQGCKGDEFSSYQIDESGKRIDEKKDKPPIAECPIVRSIMIPQAV